MLSSFVALNFSREEDLCQGIVTFFLQIAKPISSQDFIEDSYGYI